MFPCWVNSDLENSSSALVVRRITGVILVLAALGAALVDWWAVHRARDTVEAVAKPIVLTMLLFAVVVDASSGAQWAVATGLALSLAGDVFLLPVVDRFIAGLASFLLAHLAFIAAFAGSLDASTTSGRLSLVFGAGLALVMCFTLGRRIISATRLDDAAMVKPVAAYIAALSVMLFVGIGTASLVAALGAALFAMSDAVLGWNRFVAPLAHGRLLTHVPYHLGQTFIALWAIGLT